MHLKVIKGMLTFIIPKLSILKSHLKMRSRLQILAASLLIQIV